MKMRCIRCGYEWYSKCGTPKACPRCKSYQYSKKIDKIKLDIGEGVSL